MSNRCIASLSAYLPLMRLERAAALQSLRWSRLGGPRDGWRSVAGWDEDALTMAGEAARGALPAGASPKEVIFASTSAPFFERSCAALLVDALALPRTVRSIDVAGSRRCAMSALMGALEGGGSTLIATGELRPTRPGSSAHLSYGDGGAAAYISDHGGLRYLGGASLSHDLLDIYATREHPTPYAAEERFVRDVAISTILAPVIESACKAAAIKASDINIAAVPEPASGCYKAIASQLGMNAQNVLQTIVSHAGDLGAAGPLFALALAVQAAKPGDLILAVGFGSGANALIFKLEGNVFGAADAAAALKAGVATRDYIRFLSLSGSLDLDWGVRAEFEQKGQPTVLERYGRDMLGFIGGRDQLGNVQFPKSRIPVNPEADGPATLDDVRLADQSAHIVSITADRLNFSPDPPFQFGLVQFENGARVMMEFVDDPTGALKVGDKVRMRFRIKSIDRRRGLRTYFWKAAPAERPVLEA